MTKEQTRAMAARLGLRVADKEESQEICFVTDDYRRFLRDAGVREHRGEIVDTTGRVLGEHEGVEFFTIGQRRGLRVAVGRPLYVVAIDAARNRIVVGDDSDLVCGEFVVEQCNWVAIKALQARREATVKMRSRHEGAPATIEPLEANGGSVRVRFERPQRAVTPGQAAVFYEGDTVLGGGWICR
jgi:tRNA-specific 2-thiouridylase